VNVKTYDKGSEHIERDHEGDAKGRGTICTGVHDWREGWGDGNGHELGTASTICIREICDGDDTARSIIIDPCQKTDIGRTPYFDS